MTIELNKSSDKPDTRMLMCGKHRGILDYEPAQSENSYFAVLKTWDFGNIFEPQFLFVKLGNKDVWEFNGIVK